ncbi:MAG TPA: hypothetical protein VMS71_06860 [Candidatus Acidoferrum sp.]|nr:hypothetical protein [Candidatus Acidoferrum sp.]
MSIIAYFFYLVLIAGFQVILRPLTSFWGVSLNLPIFIVLTVAWYKSELTAVWFAFFAGIVISAGTPLVMGWHALAMPVLAWGTFHARVRLNIDSPAARLSVVFGGILLHNILTVAISQPDGFVYQLWRTGLTGAVYTGLLAYLLFRLRDGLFGSRRARARF